MRLNKTHNLKKTLPLEDIHTYELQFRGGRLFAKEQLSTCYLFIHHFCFQDRKLVRILIVLGHFLTID